MNGKKIGEVSNEGHGGPDNFHGDWDAFKEAQTWLAANKPGLDLGENGTIPMDVEMYCGELLTTHLISKDLKNALRGRVLFTEEGREGIFELKWKGVRKVDAAHIAVVRDKYPKAKILNEMPFEEALDIYRANG